MERSGVPSPLRDGTHRVFLRKLYRGDELLEARFTRRRLSPRLGVRGLTPRSRTPPALLGPALGRSAISAGTSCPCQRRLSQLTEMLDRDRPRRHHRPKASQGGSEVLNGTHCQWSTPRPAGSSRPYRATAGRWSPSLSAHREPRASAELEEVRLPGRVSRPCARSRSVRRTGSATRRLRPRSS